MRKHGRSLAIVVVLSMLCLVAWLYRDALSGLGREHPIASRSDLLVQPLPSDVDAAAPPALEDLRPDKPVAAGTAHDRGPSEADLYAEFVRSRDLAMLVEQLKPLAEAGNAAAARVIVHAFEECFAYALRPEATIQYLAASIATRPPEVQKPSRQLLTHYDERCAGLAAAGAITFGEIQLWLDHAVAAGDLASHLKKHKLRGLTDSSMYDESLRRLLDQARRSADPAVVAEMGFFEVQAAKDQPAPGSIRAELVGVAWDLAACDLGMDCGPNSPMLRYSCLHMGLCGYSSLEHLYTHAGHSPRDMEQVNRLRAAIVARLRRGG